jgi:hypothetical protein
LLRGERYNEALAQAQSLHGDFPGESEISQLLAVVRERVEQREQVQEAFNEVKALLEQQKFHEAMDRAETVRFQFPADSESTRLYDFAKTESGLAERRQRLELETTALQEKIKAQEYDAAIAHGEQLRQEFPSSVELARLVTRARSERVVSETSGALVEEPSAIIPGTPTFEAMEASPAQPISPPVGDLPATTSPRKRRAPIAVAAAVLLLALGGLGYKLIHKATPQAQSGQTAAQPATGDATAGIGAIAGNVTDSAGAALSGVQVVATDHFGRVQNARSRGDGSFRLDGLEPGSYMVRVEPPDGYSPLPDAKVEVTGAQDQKMNLSLLPTANASAAATKPSQGEMSPSSGPSQGQPSASQRPEIKPAVQAKNSPSPPQTAAPVHAIAGPGELVVTSNVAGAKIILDGKDSGEVTPHTFTGLASGTHALAVSAYGYETGFGRFNVQAGGSASANFDLSQPSGMLEFDTTPPGADVTIDGKSYGSSPAKANLPLGKHSYKVTLGSKTLEGTVEVRGDFTQKEVTFPQ